MKFITRTFKFNVLLVLLFTIIKMKKTSVLLIKINEIRKNRRHINDNTIDINIAYFLFELIYITFLSYK